MKAKNLDNGGFRATWLIFFETAMYAATILLYSFIGLYAAALAIVALLVGVGMAVKYGDKQVRDTQAFIKAIDDTLYNNATLPVSEDYDIIIPGKQWHLPMPKIHFAKKTVAKQLKLRTYP